MEFLSCLQKDSYINPILAHKKIKTKKKNFRKNLAEKSAIFLFSIVRLFRKLRLLHVEHFAELCGNRHYSDNSEYFGRSTSTDSTGDVLHMHFSHR